MKSFVGFAGFGGVDIALRQAGFEVQGVEIIDEIAEVNRQNGGDVVTADILDMQPGNYIGYDLMHFSPPCVSFSNANEKKGEAEQDIVLAQKMARFIVEGEPRFFTLENVWGYRNSQSWDIVLKALKDMDYGIAFWHLNAANFGVPQTRKRMTVVGRRGGLRPVRPMVTHQDYSGLDGQLALFEMLPQWENWYEAIEDLIPELPEGKFAKWQKEKTMPDHIKGSFLMPVNGENSGPFGFMQPAPTITANHSSNKYRAFIVDCQYNGNPDENGRRGLTIREADQPVFTITATQSKRKVREAGGGRVVSMTPRCLARFQDFPDWFVLPENRGLACRGIGGAVPRGLYRAVLGSLGFGKKETYTGDKI